MPYDPPPELAGLSLAEIARLVDDRKLPPLDQWTPTETGDSEMRIAADGRWFHQGSEVRRPAMVRAFASLLLCDDQGQHWLFTPFQRLAIAVEDAAFIATDVQRIEDRLAFRLNTDDLVVAGPENALMARGSADEPAIYLAVRHGCEARLNRSTWLQLAEIALTESDGEPFAVSSNGARFALVPQ